MAEQALAAAPRLFEILDEEPHIRDCASAIDLQDVEGHLIFENVSFSFPGDNRMTLDNVSFEIMPGETVAIVGGTGSGDVYKRQQ